ncbi:phosphoesterase PA-phosphatase related protein [Pseudodesulfovibrio mercurii]|uniref:Phosphoesterase PA-phosphatase related protein n=1 Tax=Pseudodesulfovibrio mercurii TaxID=641491 RepID=F0JHK6_9BACT|nr:phosphatase PAP2 family protein [Pseudodesulfovibrio mercurii]EGB14066.1 phosphoesterase PA-phosphatase related protein [Pseudodesulfovibrio mercurii]
MFFSTPAPDLHLFLLINQHWHCALLDTVMPLFSSMAVLMVLLVAAVGLAVLKGGRRQLLLFLVLLVGMGVSDFSTNLVKHQIHRVRPLNEVAGTRYVENGEWRTRPDTFVRTKENGTSYPSGHAANTMTLALLAVLLWPKLRLWPLLVPLVTGYSRLYLGKHYPTDVLAGWLWGVVVAGLVWLLWKELTRRFPALRPE